MVSLSTQADKLLSTKHYENTGVTPFRGEVWGGEALLLVASLDSETGDVKEMTETGDVKTFLSLQPSS